MFPIKNISIPKILNSSFNLFKFLLLSNSFNFQITHKLFCSQLSIKFSISFQPSIKTNFISEQSRNLSLTNPINKLIHHM